MSYVTITEYDYIARDLAHQPIAAAVTGSIKAEQRIENDGVSEPFKGHLICIYASAIVAFAFGLEPKADPTLHIRGPGVHFYGVNPGECLAVAVVKDEAQKAETPAPAPPPTAQGTSQDSRATEQQHPEVDSPSTQAASWPKDAPSEAQLASTHAAHHTKRSGLETKTTRK